jgi:hypothetical protein
MPAKKFFQKHISLIEFVVFGVATVTLLILLNIQVQKNKEGVTYIASLSQKNEKLSMQFASTSAALTDLQNQDQIKINKENADTIKNIETTYARAAKSYEALLDIKLIVKKTDAYDKLYATALRFLAEKNYAEAEKTLNDLDQQLVSEKSKFVAAQPATGPAAAGPVNNSAPGSGFSRQRVKSEIGEFTIDIVAADLNSTKVIIDTASDATCTNDCPVLPLGDYVARSGAFAGINGSYFCPASYPSCAGKTNSFDTLLMNKNKVYFNSDNNVYSTVPVVAFGQGWARFMGRSSDWGRDTGVDGVIANQPLVLSGGNIAFGGDGDPKKGSKGSRSFVANKGSTVYIGVVYNATVAEVGYALKAMGLENALNLDSGGSIALWSGGYKAGPGRNIPNAILFVRR